MNQKEYQMIFQIGANLASSFNTSFGSAYTKLNELAKETLETQKTLKDVSGFQKAKAALEENEKKLAEQKEQYDTLKTSITKQKEVIKQTTEAISANQQMLKNYSKGSYGYNEITSEIERLKETQSNATEAVRNFTESLEENERQQAKTSSAVDKNQEEIYKYSAKLAEAGINVNNLTEEQKELQEQYEELKSAREHLQKISGQYDELTSKARSQAAEVGKLAASYAAIGAVIYKGAIEPAIEFESAYAGVLKTVDGTPEQLQQIKDDILNLSTIVPTAASDIAAVAESAGQLGIATENITEFSRVMIDLGESTNLSSDEAASNLAKFANITKMDASNYSNLGSVIVDLGNNFATTEADIVSMATRLASTGSITGLSEAQIMAFATALSSVGIEAEAGGSAVSKLLKQFETMYWNDNESLGLDERKLNKYAEVAGVTIDEFKKVYGRDSLEAVSMFISGLNDVERNGKNAIQILSELGITETRMSNAVLALASSDGILTEAVSTANTAWEENTALATEAGKRYETTESQLQMAKNSISNAGIALGEVFTPYIAEAANGINEFAQNVAGWVKENPEAVKQILEFAGALGGALLTFKAIKLAGTGIQTTVTGIRKLSAEGKLLSKVKFNAAAIAIAAIGTALAVANQKYKEYLQSTSDAIMYSNGASTSLSNLAELVTNYGTEAYKAAQKTNEQAAELEGIRDNLAAARTQVEYYGQSLRKESILTPEEAANLKQPFEDLSNYLEQDFSTSFNTVFENFQTSAIGVMEELGGDIADVDGLLQAFKNKYSENVGNANQNIQNYLDKAITGTATDEDRQQFEQSQAMLYALAEADSQSKKDFDTAAAALDGIDFGADQEAAVAKIQEMTEYAKSYIEEINNAQKTVQEENESLQRKNEIQHEYGLLSDEEYENGKNALAVASVASNAAYQKSFDSFMEQYKEVLDQLQGQLDENILEVFNKSMNSGNFLADFGESAKAVWGVVINGYTTTWDEEYKKQHMDAVRETMSGIINAVDEMSRAADVAPIIIPVETAQTAVASGLINSARIKNENGKISVVGSLSLKPEETAEVIPWTGEKNARGTNYSADTFLAGENGAEIITNARGYKVYTAEETKDIFDTYTQIISFLPQLQRLNTAATVKAPVPELTVNAARNAEAEQIGVEINYSPTIYLENGSPEELEEKLKESNEQLLAMVKDYLRQQREDERRMSYA